MFTESVLDAVATVTVFGTAIVPANVFTSFAPAKLVTAPTKHAANTKVFKGFIIYCLPLGLSTHTWILIVLTSSLGSYLR